jgi:nitric-oxide synthase
MLTQEEIRARLRAIPLFASLTAAEAQRLVERLAERDVAPGEMVLKQGDQGDRMFIIDRGAVQVFATGFDGADVVLARLEKGQWFGEQSLLPGATLRRNASVRALESARLLELRRDALLEALDQHSEILQRLKFEGDEQKAFRATRLREGVFKGLASAAGADGYKIEHFPAGTAVIRQGDPGERVHLVLTGRAQVKQVKDGKEEVLSVLLPGQYFGELAILNEAPRSATVEALDDLETVSLDGGWFRAAHRSNPALRSLMDSLKSMYLLPRKGLLTLQTGVLDGKPTLTALHTLPDNRRIMTTRLVATSALTSRVLGAPAGEKVAFERGDAFRELEVADGKIVGLEAVGDWSQLGEVLGFVLDGTPVEEWRIALFREKGDLRTEDPQPLYEDTEVICACTQTTCGQIQRAIAGGCHALDDVAKKTHCTLVCGGCAPLVRELLGESSLAPARVVETIVHTPDMRTFRIKPSHGGVKPFLPGQHLVIQARIDNRWIQRPYTLTSVPDAGDCYDVTVKREPQGIFSRWLFDRMRPDSLLRVSDPAGEYVLPHEQATDVVCLVGGIGMTPALAMARALAAKPRGFRLHIDYSESTGDRFVCKDELEALPARHPSISVNLRTTRAQGRINQAQVKELVTRFPDAVYYLCGGEAFMTSVAELLRSCGVPQERIRVEVFTVAGERPDAKPAAPVAPRVEDAQQRPTSPLEAARGLLKRFYDEAGAPTAFEPRWRQVESEIKNTGTYVQTFEELAHSARVAWRNSIRCIGRMYWEGLAVRDFRNARTEDEMFQAIFSHIELATNGGNLRPVMTVFPPRGTDGTAPRVWSPQLFRYAAYAQAGGKVLGDPANVELTEVALALGWRPPETRTPFDLLPIIVQVPGKKPVARDIPKHLVMEIPIVHPELAWFADLGLKWYALPAVSAMLFDTGVVQYPAAPFNGWYMGTEIGARNFGDTNRYDLLPLVARRLGLDTSKDRTLWRDRALVELNIAVLYSYEIAGVTMMDHHAASQSFNKFEGIEARAGRPVYGKWAWLVPPISGSAVSVFHQDWPDIEIKPNYYYQPDPWKDDLSWRQSS